MKKTNREIKEIMCNKYCQYPNFDAPRVMLDLVCASCPLNDLDFASFPVGSCASCKHGQQAYPSTNIYCMSPYSKDCSSPVSRSSRCELFESK